MSPILQKAFGFNPAQNNVRTEVLAGITTFLTMAYILAVNPGVYSALPGMPAGSVFTATALAAIIGTLLMAFYAKKPFGLAPGMGLNAFFVYTVCGVMGFSWQFALTAVLLEGLIFIILSATKIRDMIVNAIPTSLKNAISSGIGIFIAFIGLKSAGVVVQDNSTLITLGNFSSPSVIIFVVGFIVTSILVVLKVKGGILIGMIAATLAGLPLGVTKFTGVVSMPAPLDPIFCQFAWSQVFSPSMLLVVLTFLLVNIFDTLGTVVGVSMKAGMADKDGHVEKMNKILMSDAIATTAASVLGTSSISAYSESAAGVAEGGRTGLTAFTVVIGFALSLFLSPIFMAIPGAATGAVLVIVGMMMMPPLKKVEWDDYSEAIPAFITTVMMPLTYSIANGIMLGMVTYVLINTFTGKIKKISIAMWVLAILFVLRYIFI